MTTAGLQAKVTLRRAWFEAHPNQPVPEARTEVEGLFAAIEAEATTSSPLVDWMRRTTENVGKLIEVGEALTNHIRRLYRICWFLTGAVVALSIFVALRSQP